LWNNRKWGGIIFSLCSLTVAHLHTELYLKWHTANVLKYFFIRMLWASSKSNKSLGTETQGLKSQVDPFEKLAGKLLSFIHSPCMLLPMYLCHYMQESVHGKDPATSTYGHTCPKDDIT
jgi:hypothetical protein